jgi:hypothetical protein
MNPRFTDGAGGAMKRAAFPPGEVTSVSEIGTAPAA